MPNVITSRDPQKIRELYGEESEDPALDSALQDFRRGRIDYAVHSMLSAFRGTCPLLVFGKGRIDFRGSGLERVHILVNSDKPVATVAVQRKIIAKFNVQHDPREREALVRWLRKYSAKRQTAALREKTSSGQNLLRNEVKPHSVPTMEAAGLEPGTKVSTLMAPLAGLHF